MTDLLFYFAKVAGCSALLFGYYWIALRNKKCFSLNRVYLLSAVVISLVVPLVHFNIYDQTAPSNDAQIHVLKSVASTNSFLDELPGMRRESPATADLILFIYTCICLICVAALVRSVWVLMRNVNRRRQTMIHGVRLVETELPYAPFSFWNTIFWNSSIPIGSVAGQKILAHEIAHISGRHSIDTLFLRTVLCFVWCNPFFWLIRKELSVLHEFIADESAVADGDASTLASLILQTAYPAAHASLVHPFFQTSIKRRIHMMSKIQAASRSRFARIALIPFLLLIITAFTVRHKTGRVDVSLSRDYTVVVDAGHGLSAGKHTGAVEGNVSEDELNLAIARKIVAANTNPHIKFILSRSTEDLVSLEDRVKAVTANNADLFLSVHVNYSPSKTSSGFEVVVSAKDNQFLANSVLFGSALQAQLNMVHPTLKDLQKKKVGIYVLDRNACPAVLVECGYISNQRDREFIINEKNQNLVAQQMLNGIDKYLSALEKN